MIPRPIYKILAFVLLPTMVFGGLWLWFTYAAEPKSYYLSYRSGFLYERLLLPPLPTFPGTQPTPDQYHLLAVACPAGTCLATPATYAARVPAFDVLWTMPRQKVRALLDAQVYRGSPLATISWLVFLALVVWSALFVGALILDFRRRRRMLAGIQINGRWPVAPSWFSGWFGRKISIDVSRANDKTAPL